MNKPENNIGHDVQACRCVVGLCYTELCYLSFDREGTDYAADRRPEDGA